MDHSKTISHNVQIESNLFVTARTVSIQQNPVSVFPATCKNIAEYMQNELLIGISYLYYLVGFTKFSEIGYSPLQPSLSARGMLGLFRMRKLRFRAVAWFT